MRSYILYGSIVSSLRYLWGAPSIKPVIFIFQGFDQLYLSPRRDVKRHEFEFLKEFFKNYMSWANRIVEHVCLISEIIINADKSTTIALDSFIGAGKFKMSFEVDEPLVLTCPSIVRL